MSIYIDADARDRTSTDRTFQVRTASYKPISVRTVQLVELTDECIDKIVSKIKNVKPVVRGEWTDTTHGLICSACKTYQVYGSRFYNFCPICGADMRGGEDDN